MDTTTTKKSASRRGKLKITAVLAALLIGIFALNAPITMASSSTANRATTTLNQDSTTEVSNQTSNDAIANVAAKANPATVTVINLQQQSNPYSQSNGSDNGNGSSNGDNSQVVPVGSGSGYIIDEAGHVVTNNHVVEGGVAFQVTLMDGTTVDATLVGTDPYQDVAVLQLKLADGQKVPGTVKFGDSSTMKVGDTVIAIGTPYGEYANTVTAGIINATDRSLDTGEGYSLPNLIQHDAAIYPGNSGGPLLNTDGDVIGMNVAKAVDPSTGYQSSDDSTVNIDFAIESNAVKTIVDQIISTGTVARPYLGIRGQQTDQGQTVVSVEADGPAAKAGIEAGDVITEIDGKTIDANDTFINELIFNHQSGDTVTLTVVRNGETQQIKVTLGTRPADTN